MFTLRLHASYGAKITKIYTPWYDLLDYFMDHRTMTPGGFVFQW